jgi:membrane protein implicated in regulation of membrane protease activity
VTGEPILLEVRTAPEAYWAFLDPGPWTRVLGFSYWAPWRALALGALGVVAGMAVHSDLLLGISLAGALALAISEVLHRRDFITTTRIVRQSGLFGNRRTELPVASVERVQVSYPKVAWRFRAGDVEVSGVGQGLTLVGVADPEAVAEAIINARDSAPKSGAA